MECPGHAAPFGVHLVELVLYPWSCWSLILVFRDNRKRNVLLSVWLVFAWLLCPCSLSVSALLVVSAFGVLMFSGAFVCVCVSVCVWTFSKEVKLVPCFLNLVETPF